MCNWHIFVWLDLRRKLQFLDRGCAQASACATCNWRALALPFKSKIATWNSREREKERKRKRYWLEVVSNPGPPKWNNFSASTITITPQLLFHIIKIKGDAFSIPPKIVFEVELTKNKQVDNTIPYLLILNLSTGSFSSSCGCKWYLFIGHYEQFKYLVSKCFCVKKINLVKYYNFFVKIASFRCLPTTKISILF